MTRDEFFKHLQHLDRPFEIQPPPQGFLNNRFTLGNWDGHHVIIRTDNSDVDFFLPYNLIEGITPGTVKVTKTIRVTGKSFE